MEKTAAIIGMGRMGVRHAQAVQASGLKLVALADSKAENLTRACDELKLPATLAFSSLDEGFFKAKPDLVIIATTANAHADLTVRCAVEGIAYILCEKPMAVSVADCDRMIEACEKSGSVLSINHGLRYMPKFARARDWLREGRIGEFASMAVIAGEGGLSMKGVHYIEAFAQLAGSPFARAWGRLHEPSVANPRGAEFRDESGCAFWETENGKRLHLEMGRGVGLGCSVVYAGSHGQIVVNEVTGTAEITARRAEDWDLPGNRYNSKPVVTRFDLEPMDVMKAAAALVSNLLNGGEVPTAPEAREAVRAVGAAIHSSELDGTLVPVGSLSNERRFAWA